jgi:hypothetical protein
MKPANKKLMTVPEASQKPMRAYVADSGSGATYVIDRTGPKTFVAVRDLKGKWRATGVTDGGLTEYHLILNYDEVVHLVTAARTSLSL